MGFPGAVLFGPWIPSSGVETHDGRGEGDGTPLCSGPGRLGQALGVSGELDGHPFSDDPLTTPRQVGGSPTAEIGNLGPNRNQPSRRLAPAILPSGHPEVSGKPQVIASIPVLELCLRIPRN